MTKKIDFNFGDALRVVDAVMGTFMQAKADGKITVGEIRRIAYKSVKAILEGVDVWDVKIGEIRGKLITIGVTIDLANEICMAVLKDLNLKDMSVGKV